MAFPSVPRRGVTVGILVLAVALSAVGLARLRPGTAAPFADVPDRYNLEHAMALAGDAVPSHVESFYFFVLDRGAPDERPELAEKLAAAATERDYLGITGAHPDHNLTVLRGALAQVPVLRLDGLVLIYVGPSAQEALVAAVAAGRGVDLRFIAYEHRRDDTI